MLILLFGLRTLHCVLVGERPHRPRRERYRWEKIESVRASGITAGPLKRRNRHSACPARRLMQLPKQGCMEGVWNAERRIRQETGIQGAVSTAARKGCDPSELAAFFAFARRSGALGQGEGVRLGHGGVAAG